MRRIAIVADDNTGATDAAGMLTSCGASALLILDPDLMEAEEAPGGYDVVVVSTRIRSIKPDEAYSLTSRVIEGFRRWNYDTIQLKYCSTFDSTPEGNIGQSLDAACDLLGFSSTIVCPALPVNGRSTYMGYHFVNGRLLSESPLRNHPLNPMTDADLVRWLGHQTERPVGLVDLRRIHRGSGEVRKARKQLEEEGKVYHVTDAVEQSDIDLVVQEYGDSGFLSGGSGVSQAFGNLYFGDSSRHDYSGRLAALKPNIVVISGSESPTAHAQREHAVEHDFEEVKVHPLDILKGELEPAHRSGKAGNGAPASRDAGGSSRESLIQGAADRAAKAYEAGKNVILALDRENGGDVKEVNEAAEKRGLSPVEVGERIAHFMGKVAKRLVNEDGIERLLVAGGETSGAVCHECGFRALEVGLPIDPGVPYCFPAKTESGGNVGNTGPQGTHNSGGPLVILKSGNFGKEDLYSRAALLGHED